MNITESLHALLDKAHDHLVAREGFQAFRLLEAPLRDLYSVAMSSGAELSFIQAARSHEIFKITQLDPFTRRCNEKPRGYAGDAVMLDYVYSRTPPADTSILGQHWFDYTTVGSMALSVKYRKLLLHSMIDDIVSQQANYRILSVASGHCRELENSLVVAGRFEGRFVAFDQDAESCEFVRQEYASQVPQRIEIVNQSVRRILSSESPLKNQQFDFIYSAGLYDYLNDRTAAALTSALCDMLAPTGGRLLIANFVPESQSRGYAEAFMDWRLNYRTPAQLEATFGERAHMVTSQLDPHRNVVYTSYRSS